MRRFLIDNQLPGALVQWLESKGCSAQHVLTLNLAQSLDEVIWLQAAREGAVILSKDEDFARLSLMRTEEVAVVWLRLVIAARSHCWRPWSGLGPASASSLMRRRA